MMISRIVVATVFSLTLSTGIEGLATAQQPAKKDFTVIHLKYTSATSIANLLQEAFGGQKANPNLRIVPDERTNAILVSASAADLDTVRDLVAKIDVPASREGGDVSRHSLKIFTLRNVIPDKSLESSLKLAMSGTQTGRI